MEVSEQPPHYLQVGSNPFRDREPEILKMDYETLVEEFEQAKNDVVARYPSIDQKKIDKVHRLIYNVYLIKEGTEYTSDPLEKREAAVIQHDLAHHFFFASTSKAKDDFVRGMYRVARMGDLLYKRGQENKYTTAATVFWTATKGELAVIKALKEGNLEVFLPNYNQDFYPQARHQDEVLQFDVLSGIDLITILSTERSRTALLVDVKTKAEKPPMQTPRVEEVPVRYSALNSLTRGRLEELGAVSVRRVRIRAPTQALGLTRFIPLQDIDELRAEMIRFSRLRHDMKSVIIEQVRSIAGAKNA